MIKINLISSRTEFGLLQAVILLILYYMYTSENRATFNNYIQLIQLTWQSILIYLHLQRVFEQFGFLHGLRNNFTANKSNVCHLIIDML